MPSWLDKQRHKRLLIIWCAQAARSNKVIRDSKTVTLLDINLMAFTVLSFRDSFSSSQMRPRIGRITVPLGTKSMLPGASKYIVMSLTLDPAGLGDSEFGSHAKNLHWPPLV
jgi:hypothetical protein